MFVVHKKDIVLDGGNPTLMTGYGGFGSILLPYFDPSYIPFIEKGGIFVSCNLRGGGEYGDTWHKSATRVHKQKTFDDFIAGAEYLIENNYTNPQKLAAMGTSNGGLLVSAVMLQRPDLFKAIVSRFGVHDMLRFQEFTVGKAWIGDYGSVADSLEFRALYKYSPLHNVKEKVEYPAILCVTADHDDRVVPAHTFKFVATLQEKTNGVNPVLCLVNARQGHANKQGLSSKLVDDYADIYSFIYHQLDIK